MSSPAASKARLEQPIPHPTIGRRSFTLPQKPHLRREPVRSSSSDSATGIETLFICPHAKIVSFTTAGPTRRLSPLRFSQHANAAPENLSWQLPATERVLAAGALRIYCIKASSVSFLNSGDLLHTIFPKSCAWCVDDQSIFVLRVRQDSYYRIELPYETDEDKASIAQFKIVLSQVLLYERRSCPFARDFHVDQIDRPLTPPRPRSKQQYPTSRAKKWLFDKNWVPENGVRPSTPTFNGSDCGSAYDDDDRLSIFSDGSEVVPEAGNGSWGMPGIQPPRRLSIAIAERASIFQDMRSTSVPNRGMRTMSSASLGRIPESMIAETCQESAQAGFDGQVAEVSSMASSADAFCSCETGRTDGCSPRYVDAEEVSFHPWASLSWQKEPLSRGRSVHRRQVSEVTVRPASKEDVNLGGIAMAGKVRRSKSRGMHDVHPSSAPSTPPLVDDSDDDSLDLPALTIPTPPDATRMKRLTGASQRRAFSPMPGVQTLFLVRRPHSDRDFTNALVRKTCELVLGPPAHIVSLMLRIARSISSGFSFGTYRVTPSEEVPCGWESDDDANWQDEDDYGIRLTRRRMFSDID